MTTKISLRNQALLPFSLAKKLLHYDPKTGIITRKVQMSPNARIGDIAGCINELGYVKIDVNGHGYLGHRLAWLLYYGYWPTNRIDHRDEVRSNNRISNLREATQSQNLFNSSSTRGNSLPRGVSKTPRGRYTARIHKNYKTIYLGTFDTVEEAASIYKDASLKIHGEFSIYAK